MARRARIYITRANNSKEKRDSKAREMLAVRYVVLSHNLVTSLISIFRFLSISYWKIR